MNQNPSYPSLCKVAVLNCLSLFIIFYCILENCYICKTFDACINKEEDCETKCPDDELCIDQVKNLNSGTDTSFQSFRIIYLFIFLGY